MSFRKDFVWGAAAASYQIEGSAFRDGKGLSVWDLLCHHRDKAVWSGHTGDVACDHYRRYRQDVALMKSLGLGGYRLSVAWPRVFPEGTGKVNAKGLAFYDRLVDELLAAGIEPFVTLFHWDYPYELYCRGGWLNADSPDWFADYTATVVRKLSDRVRFWFTMNEPQCFVGLGHASGVHAPGLKLGMLEELRAAHHALLAHGKAVQAIRAGSRRPARVGCVPVAVARIPASNRKADIEAARRATFAADLPGTWNTSWWLDPMFLGRYPADGLKAKARYLPHIRTGDMKTIAQKLDFCAFNIYSADTVKASSRGPNPVPPYPGHPMTAFNWWVTPEALYWAPKFLYERYRKPIYVTENGMSNRDVVSLDGRVHDPQRIDFLARYLAQLKRASADGVDVRGYFVWSILDNFEWAEGYKERFGIVYVDYRTGRRIPKDSAYWYRDLIKANGANLPAGRG